MVDNVFDTIYKRTVSGKIQQWHVELEGERYRTISGLAGGKKVTSEWTYALPTNVGRANHRPADRQALAEVESMYEHKLTRGYVTDIENVDNVKLVPFKPMLAKKYEDYSHKLNFPVLSQPKLDGLRCNVFVDGALTRTGKPFVTVTWLVEQLQPFFQRFGDELVVDGELYPKTDANINFNQLVSLLKKQKPTVEQVQQCCDNVDLWVYDIAGTNLPYQHRKSFFLEPLEQMNLPNVTIVDTKQCNDSEHLDSLFAEYMAEGFEGQMVRDMTASYENKRSKALLKRKEFDDEEFTITDVEEGIGNRSGMAGAVHFLTEEGKPFRAGLIGSHEYCEKVLKNKEKLIGKSATVVYFRRTPDNLPRFPKVKIIHETERW